MKALMVVGTDTGVGKTRLCELLIQDALARSEEVGIYKPVCSGSRRTQSCEAVWDDLVRLSNASGGRFDQEWICPQRFHAPLAPPVSAALEGREVDERLLTSGLLDWQGRVKTLVIEGVGGLLCPVSRRWTVADLAEAWNVPIVVVSVHRLGTINHTLLTLHVAQSRGLTVAGWLMNLIDPPTSVNPDECESNIQEIAARTNVPFRGVMHYADAKLLQSECSFPRMFAGPQGFSLNDLLRCARPCAALSGV